MNAKILIVAVCAMVMIAACSKDKFSTTPQLTFKSINNTQFVADQIINIKLGLTDKEGDFEASEEENSPYMKQYFFYKRISFTCPEDTTTNIFEIPAFMARKDLDVDVNINLIYGSLSSEYVTISRCAELRDDSLYFRMWIKDEAGNVSDTIDTPTFKLLKD